MVLIYGTNHKIVINETALITGGLGFVGSYIAKDLIEQKSC